MGPVDRVRRDSPFETSSGRGPTLMAAEPKSEVDLIRALSEDLALEILASYMPEDFADADFTSLGEAAVYEGSSDTLPRGPGYTTRALWPYNMGYRAAHTRVNDRTSARVRGAHEEVRPRGSRSSSRLMNGGDTRLSGSMQGMRR